MTLLHHKGLRTGYKPVSRPAVKGTKKRILCKWIALLTALTMMSGLSACGGPQNLELRLDMAGGVQNLDPQFATDLLGCTILANTMEGLLHQDEEGQLQPAGAESWTVSPNGLDYRFVLRRDARWSNGDPVIAQDYVFAFRRIFDPQVPSPYAEEYSAISGARRVLEGTLPNTGLGVRAIDDYTLEITLEKASPTFEERLAQTAATPCNQKFFEETRARYGLGQEYLLFNGPYSVTSWNNTKSIILRPNDTYRTPPQCPGVVFYTNRLVTAAQADERKKETAAIDLFREGKSDVYSATAQDLERLKGIEINLLEIENRIWQLTFNTREGILENQNHRRAIVQALDDTGYRERVPQMYGMAQGLIPKSIPMEGGGQPRLLGYSPDGAKAAAAQGKEELGEGIDANQLTLILPESAGLELLGGYLQKQWKDELSLYVNMKPLPDQEFQKNLETGDFTIALRPMEASGQDPVTVLEEFSSASVRNYGGWQDTSFDQLLEQAGRADSRTQSDQLYRQAEQMLLDQAVAVPLLTQSSYFAFGKGVSGVALVGGRLDFRNAVRVE